MTPNSVDFSFLFFHSPQRRAERESHLAVLAHQLALLHLQQIVVADELGLQCREGLSGITSLLQPTQMSWRVKFSMGCVRTRIMCVSCVSSNLSIRVNASHCLHGA